MRRRESGLTLVEVLVALVLVSMVLLAVVPTFMTGTRVAASSADLGTAGAEAVRRMEILRQTPFNALPSGGNLSTSVVGYSEVRPGAVVRWTVASTGTPPSIKTIVVRSIARRRVIGVEKEVTLTTLRSR